MTSNMSRLHLLNLEDDYTEAAYSIIEKNFEGRHLETLTRHQSESYNDFVGVQAPKTIQMFNPVSVKSEQDYIPETDKYKLELEITFQNYSMFRPQIHENNGATKLMFPQDARLRNFTYASSMTVDISIKYIVRHGENLDSVQVNHKVFAKYSYR